MANTKITTAVIKDDAITSAKIADDVALGGNPTTTTQSAGNNTTRIATTAFVTTAVSNLVDSAPSALDTLNELAAALGDDANFSTTITNSIATKAALAGAAFTGDVSVTGSSSGSTVLTLTSNALADTPLMVFQRTGGAVAGKLAYEDGNTAISFGTTTTHELKLLTNNTNRLEIDSSGNSTFSGNVGIGGSPDSDSGLHLKGDGKRILVDSDDYNLVSLGRRGSSGAGLDKAYFRMRNAGTNIVVIDTDGSSYFNGGSVGIGTSTPTTGKLQVKGAGTSSSTNAIFAENSSGAGLFAIRDDGEGFILGNTGIGTSNPAQKFVVAEGTNQHGIELAPGSLSYIQAYDRATSDYGNLKIDAETIAFGTNNGAEAARFDALQNFLIGRTATFTNTHTVEIEGKGSSECLALNARTDGEALTVYRDGNSVGIIGAYGGDLTIGTGDTGLTFEDSADVIHPINAGSGAARDDAIDLGKSAARFKDLYLSGNVKVGAGQGILFGGAAGFSGMTSQVLDDYEEGTFSATTAAGISVTTTTGSYTKIGRLVFINADLTVASGSTSGTQLIFTGLPFTGSETFSTGSINFTNLGSSFSDATLNFDTGNGGITVRRNNNGTPASYAEFAGKRIIFNLLYHTAQ